MATAYLTDNGNLKLQEKFRTLATRIKVTGTKSATPFSVQSEEDINWSSPNTGDGVTNLGPINFIIPISPQDGTVTVNGIQLLDSVNRIMLEASLPAGSVETYSYYVGGVPDPGTILDGASGKYTLAQVSVEFAT